MLGLAARVWQHAGLAAATSDALLKLKAAGVEIDREALDVVQPQVARRRAGVRAVLAGGVDPHARCAFGYRKAAATTSERPRTLQPWGIVSYRSPLVRRRPRHRPGRAAAVPALPGQRRGRSCSASRRPFEVPEGTDLRALTASLAPRPSVATARRRAARPPRPRGGAAPRPRRRGRRRPRETAGTASSCASATSTPPAETIAAYGPDVVVDGPEDLRARRARPAGRRREDGVSAAGDRAPGPGHAAAGPGALPAGPGRDLRVRRGRGVRRQPRHHPQRPRRALVLRPARARHGRPDRGRLRRPRGRRRHPASATPTTSPGRCAWTAPRPPALIVALRSPARDDQRDRARGRRPHPGQARGRRRGGVPGRPPGPAARQPARARRPEVADAVRARCSRAVSGCA